MGYDIMGDSKSSGEGPGLLALLKTVVGILLVVAGVSLGLYVAVTVIGLVQGGEPPRLVAHFAEDSVEGNVELPGNNGPVKFEFSPNVLQAATYVLTFLFLTIPTSIAGGLLKGGVGLLDSDSSKVLKQLVDSLRAKS